jgi:allantoinase
MNPDLILRSTRVVTPEGVRPACVHVRDRKIAAVQAHDRVPAGVPLDDAGDLVIMPGIVDTHVHLNEPGRVEWEGFETGTRAAAAGGITTLVEMPLNSIPATTHADACRAKLAAAEGKCHVDVGFWGGVVPGNSSHLRALWDAGVFGFKCFLCPSGVQEFPHVSVEDLRPAMKELAALGATLLVHAEVPGPLARAEKELADAADPRRHATWLALRPHKAENEAIALMVGLSVEYGVPVHIVHLASSDALLLLKWARRDGIRITAETCHHHLTFCSEEVPDGATEFKCAPPVRERENRERLWAALEEDLLDFVATDHSPAPLAMKQRDTGNFLKAWGGIASLQLSLPALWTEAQKRGHPIERMGQWLCAGPARLAGLQSKKGGIAAGLDADFVIWNPDAEFTVDAQQLHHRNKLTPYDRRTLRGVVARTYLRGTRIFDGGAFPAAAAGSILKRGQA